MDIEPLLLSNGGDQYRSDRLGEVQLVVLTRYTPCSILCPPAEPAADPYRAQPVPGHLLTEHLQEETMGLNGKHCR